MVSLEPAEQFKAGYHLLEISVDTEITILKFVSKFSYRIPSFSLLYTRGHETNLLPCFVCWWCHAALRWVYSCRFWTRCWETNPFHDSTEGFLLCNGMFDQINLHVQSVHLMNGLRIGIPPPPIPNPCRKHKHHKPNCNAGWWVLKRCICPEPIFHRRSWILLGCMEVGRTVWTWWWKWRDKCWLGCNR